MQPCAVDGCDKPAAKREPYCAGHAKRKRRGKPLSTPLREYGQPLRALRHHAALRYAEAEEDAEFRRAFDLLQKYARRVAFRRKRHTETGAHT